MPHIEKRPMNLAGSIMDKFDRESAELLEAQSNQIKNRKKKIIHQKKTESRTRLTNQKVVRVKTFNSLTNQRLTISNRIKIKVMRGRVNKEKKMGHKQRIPT